MVLNETQNMIWHHKWVIKNAAQKQQKMCYGNSAFAPLFKFGFNPSLIDGILNVLPYELAS